ncbi:transcription termination/antitermination NusG family protein [Pseudophaeobacter sp. C1-32P7]|uniref:transcription termination/antitermination NusG family protein n=1 Tax=Pseudophaeobacter sp. C1-32P7 TaxID=3098142 RepID=UPI0034D6BEC5
MTYTIGQEVAFGKMRRLMGDPLQDSAQWFVLKTAPLKEFELREWLKREEGVLDAWLPTEKAWRSMPRSRRRKAAYEKKIAPGYVFVCVDRSVAWDVLRERANGKVAGVVGRDGRPLPVPDEEMRRMRRLPSTIKKIYADQQEAKRIRPGDKARMLDDAGVMADWVVDVSAVNGGIARIFLPLLGGREATVSVDTLERIHNVA